MATCQGIATAAAEFGLGFTVSVGVCFLNPENLNTEQAVTISMATCQGFATAAAEYGLGFDVWIGFRTLKT